METTRFFFWETMKVLGLAILGLAAAKAIGGLRLSRKQQLSSSRRDEAGSASLHSLSRKPFWPRFALYAALLVLVSLGARGIGNEVAAEIYFMASRDNLAQSHPVKAYANASRAVERRPEQVKYWQMLSTCKFALRQYESLLDDRRALESLEQGHLSEQDAMRFAYAHYMLAQYDQSIALARQLIKENRVYAAAYVLLGIAHAAKGDYAGAERPLLEILQIYPNHENAVEALAHTYFLMGQTARALSVLNETAKFPFNPDARKRFEQ